MCVDRFGIQFTTLELVMTSYLVLMWYATQNYSFPNVSQTIFETQNVMGF